MGESNRKLEEKKKKFEENPNDFVCLDDVVLMIDFNQDNNMNLYANGDKLKHFPQALGLLMLQVPRAELYFKSVIAKEKQSSIITPGENGKSRFQA